MSLLQQSELHGLIDSAMREKGRIRKGNNLTYHCPFCHHRKRKMEVSLDTHEWHCWVCNAKGRTIHGLFSKMQVDESTSRKLNSIIPNESDKVWTPPKESAEKVIVQLPREFKSLLTVEDTRGYRHAKRYAKERKLSKLDIIKYNIGYCDSGEYEDRLIIPSYGADNQLNFFTGRSFFDDNPYRYKNPEVDKNIIGFENLVDFNYPVAICEGGLDAIAIKRNSIPLFGKTLSDKLRTALTSDQVREIFIVLDDDALKSAIEIAEFLLSYDKIVHLVNLKGKDPNKLGSAETAREMKDTPPLEFTDLLKLKLNL